MFVIHVLNCIIYAIRLELEKRNTDSVDQERKILMRSIDNMSKYVFLVIDHEDGRYHILVTGNLERDIVGTNIIKMKIYRRHNEAIIVQKSLIASLTAGKNIQEALMEAPKIDIMNVYGNHPKSTT